MRARVPLAFLLVFLLWIPTAGTAQAREKEPPLVAPYVLFPFSSPDEGDGDVWIGDEDGRPSVRLTHTPHIDEAPGSWAPAGRRIVFEAGRYDSCEIEVMRANGTRRHALTNDDVTDGDPAWSPDGRWIAWIRQENFRGGRLWLMRPDGSHRRQIQLDGMAVSNPTWSPDGSRIAFSMWPRATTYPEIFTVRPDGSGLTRLTRNLALDSIQDWSANGKLLLYTRESTFRAEMELNTIAPDGSHRRRLTPDWGAVTAKFLPGGDVVAESLLKSGTGALFHVPRRGGEPRPFYEVDGEAHLDTYQCS